MHWYYTKVHLVASSSYEHPNSNLLSYRLLYNIMMKRIYGKKMWVKNAGTHRCKKHRYMEVENIRKDKRWNPQWKKVTYTISILPWLLSKVNKILLVDKTIAFIENLLFRKLDMLREILKIFIEVLGEGNCSILRMISCVYGICDKSNWFMQVLKCC